MTERDVGEVQRLRVWHDNGGSAGAWHLAHIALSRSRSGDSNSSGGGSPSPPPLYFVCNDWLAPPSCERVLQPVLSMASMVGEGTRAGQRVQRHAGWGEHWALPGGPGGKSAGRMSSDYLKVYQTSAQGTLSRALPCCADYL